MIKIKYVVVANKELATEFINAIRMRVQYHGNYHSVPHDEEKEVEISDATSFYRVRICSITRTGNLRLPISITMDETKYGKISELADIMQYVDFKMDYSTRRQTGDGMIKVDTCFKNQKPKELCTKVRELILLYHLGEVHK